MQQLLKSAGLSPDVLMDKMKRAAAISEFNARSGGLRGLMQSGKLEVAPVAAIPEKVAVSDIQRYLRFIGEGRRAAIIFAAGRATRMKLPSFFDKLGIGGLTGRILSRINTLREGEDAPMAKLEASLALRALVDETASGKMKSSEDMSLLQRQLLQYRWQAEKLFRENPIEGISFKNWLSRAAFVVIANEANSDALSRQMAGIKFAGLNPENVYAMIQHETGGLEVLPDGSTRPYDAERWPEGHGKPFIDLCTEGIVGKLALSGVQRAVFAQVNDLHLLEDMAHLERWVTADACIAEGAQMVMEMVENGLGQKGGGIFRASDGNTVMRDTIAMKTPDLESYSVPKSLSRMFYELTLAGLAKLKPGTLPVYITERAAVGGRAVLTAEYYSGDASGILKARAIQQKGYALDTFKVQSRIPHTLQALARQDEQPGFQVLQTV